MKMTLADWHATFRRSVLSLEPKTLQFKLINPRNKAGNNAEAYYNERTPESCKKFLLTPINEQELPALLVDADSDLRTYYVEFGVMESEYGTKIITEGVLM